MPDDVGGRPFPDGDVPDDRSHGEAEDAFASVVFDEDFVRSAEVHEPTAVERMLAAAEARAEAEAARRRTGAATTEDDPYDDGYGPDGDYGHDPDDERGPYGRFGRDGDPDDPYGPYGRYGGERPYRGHARWQRPIAWLLAVLMGIGVVALAFAAVYRGASGGRQEPSPPPATRGESLSEDSKGAFPAPGGTSPRTQGLFGDPGGPVPSGTAGRPGTPAGTPVVTAATAGAAGR
ncbi:SCO2584 family spore wall biosynthesis protein [Streptomyces pactum]|uniref:SCO2584 family spore wall biosynthesis protein n=1 Tax=Streptomyces pactum TaxID=68249 RepID=UPI0036F98F04